MMDAIWRDVRFAARGLIRSPAFTAIAVLTLALGIGANTAIFSVVNAVLLRPLAYREPDRLVSIRSALDGRSALNVPSSAPEYQDYRREVPAVQDIAAVWPININLTGQGDPERIQAAVVSTNYFSVLGVAPVLGRDFSPEDDGGRIGYVTLISYDLWQRRFGGDRERDRNHGPAGRRSDDHHRRDAEGLPPPGRERRVADGGVGADRAGEHRLQLHRLPRHAGLRSVRPAGARRDGAAGGRAVQGPEQPALGRSSPTSTCRASGGGWTWRRWRSAWWATCGLPCSCCWARSASCS